MQLFRMPKFVGVRKLLLITTAIVSIAWADPANADPITQLAVAAWGWITSGTIAAGIALNLGISVLVGALSKAFGKKQQDVLRELTIPTSLPVYRFVYGKTWAPGTPAPVRVKGKYIYCCYLLNSRPSAGPFTLFLDKREVEATGDPYDFEGGGAVATNELFDDHCIYWIGKGDQISPPDLFLSEAPEFFNSTDGWQGRTVIWMRLDAGSTKTRQERWPSSPPEIMVDGLWSLVRDPRTPEAPAAYSANQALCTLDALRENPLRPYDDRNLWLETFEWAADVADTDFAVKGGGVIPRFETNGVLVFSAGSEIEDQILPLAMAGASEFTRVGGRLGLIPAVYSEPVMTVNKVLTDGPMTFNKYRPANELMTEVTATFMSPVRLYEDATTPRYVIAGAQAEDGGISRPGQVNLGMVTDYRQAQYVASIYAKRTRMQKTWSGILPGSAFDLVAGSTATWALPVPYSSRNGIYKVEQIEPGADPTGIKGGVALRCAVSAREESAWIYEWNFATDEKDMPEGENVSGSIVGIGIPGVISLLTEDIGFLRLRFSFEPSSSASVTGYEWEYSRNDSEWISGGFIDAESFAPEDNIFGYLQPVTVGDDFKIRVRANAFPSASEWRVSDNIEITAPDYLAGSPSPISAVGGENQITVIFESPNDPDYKGMEIWSSSVDDIGLASLLFGPVYGAPNSTTIRTETGLGDTETRFYFARSLDINDQPSPFSTSLTATTDS